MVEINGNSEMEKEERNETRCKEDLRKRGGKVRRGKEV